jgi:hypothetical protein
MNTICIHGGLFSCAAPWKIRYFQDTRPKLPRGFIIVAIQIEKIELVDLISKEIAYKEQIIAP